MEPKEDPSLLIKYFAPTALGAEPTRLINVAKTTFSFFSSAFVIS
jgi:hypothetical protein